MWFSVGSVDARNWVGTADDSGHSTQTGAHAAVVDDPPLGEEHPIHEDRIA
jgi:hypothetical protein